jgi:NAD(P)-dependent dehydrogenase (short-subunit alcohol dehydrogenase family)
MVIISARNKQGPLGIDQAVDNLNKLPVNGKAFGIIADVADTDDIGRLVQKVCETHHMLDILVCNAGATRGGPFEPTPDWATKKVLDLNVRGVFNLVRFSVPLLAKSGTPQDPSRIIIVSSVAGTTVPHVGDNGTIMYSVSKAAAHHLARQLAVELGPRNITTNTVAPGFFPSKLASGLIEKLGGRRELEARNPRKRLGEPEDIAGVMAYLASPAAAYVNGEDTAVDGGSRYSAGRQSNL